MTLHWWLRTVLPRKNSFVRADERQRRQIIAANLDQVLIVVAPRPLPSRDLMERYLLAVHSLGIKPVDRLQQDRPASGCG